MIDKIFEKLQHYTYFVWLVLLVIVAVFVTYFYDTNKKNQIYYLQKSFDNVYLRKSINSVTSKLLPRYVTINYIVQKDDTYENIINKIELPISEKKKIYRYS